MNLKSISERIIVALDLDLSQAKRLVEELGDTAVFYKVGLSLFYEAGDEIIDFLKEREKKIFLDLKLFDIPFQLKRAAAAVSRYQPELLTVHSLAGAESVKAAREGASPSTKIIAVTVLTSIAESGANDISGRVLELSEQAISAGADGVVCSGLEVERVKERFPDRLAVVPGIRLEMEASDQKRVVTPAQAFSKGADYIVVGREITRSSNPVASFENIAQSVLSARIYKK